MLRNREVKVFFLSFAIIFIVSISVAMVLDLSPVLLTLSTGFIYLVLFICFTWNRYRHIKQLSEYIREISGGNYTLDVRDNVEGELSILKNEIYKVTSTLAEQSKELQNDKIHLMDAISDISHQLKTPLTSMTMMADFLASPSLPEEKREEFSSLLLKQLQRIDWLVTSLLTLSKIDAGTVSFKKEDVHVRSLLDFVLEQLDTNHDEKNIRIQQLGASDVYIQCDKNWTAEALINIMNNCIQHSPPNETIAIDWESNALYTQIRMQDNGPGISLEERTQIFKRFFKGKDAGDESVGIGLAMAYSIMTNQHGNIEVESELGKGTTFIITFYRRR